MYHGPKSAISVKTFHLPFSMESYLFLQFKMCHTVTDYLEHREKATIYNNILDMEAWTTVVHKEFIKINYHRISSAVLQNSGGRNWIGACKGKACKIESTWFLLYQ